MKKFFVTILICAAISGTAFAFERVYQKADLLYMNRTDTQSVEAAIELIKTTLQEDPQNYNLLWRLSRIYNWIGDISPDKNQRLSNYELGKFYAEQAINASNEATEGHYYRGLLLLKISDENGMLGKVAVIDPARTEMEAALKINPEHAGAHNILAMIYRIAPLWPLSIGDLSKSLEEALLAVKYASDQTYSHLGLAESYMALGKKDDAAKELQMVIDMKQQPDYIPEGKRDKEKAEILLKELYK